MCERLRSSIRHRTAWTLLGLSIALLGAATRAAEQILYRFPRHDAATTAVPVYRVASGRIIHRFFDTSPVSPSGRYLALFRLPYEDRSPRAGDAGEVIVVDLANGHERVVATSRGWEYQVGANVQWGATDTELYFNDVDVTTWKAFAVQLNPLTGATRRLDGTVFMVSPDGKQLASHNLIVSRRAQVGYGVVVPDAAMPPPNVGPVATDGVNLTDVATGASRRLITIREIYERSRPSIAIPNPEEFEYYCFQVKWNPQGTRLLATVQWSPRADRAVAGVPAGKGRRRAVITMRPDGSDLRTAVTPAQWARGGHHVNWMPDGEQLSMNLAVDDERGLELIQVRADGAGMKVLFKPGSGHPSQHPGGLPFVITDAYPDEPVARHDGTSPIRLIDLARAREQLITAMYVSMTAGEFRVDPHPAWDRTRPYIIFNGFVGGTRNVFLADLSTLLKR